MRTLGPRMLVMVVCLLVIGSSGGASIAAVRPRTPGEQLWSASYGDPIQANAAWALALSSDQQRVYVTGGAQNFQGSDTFATVAYDAVTGAQLWVRSYPGGQSGAVVVSPDGRSVVVTGTTLHNGTDDFTTIAYDAATGRQRWVALFDDPLHSFDAAADIAMSPDGRTVVVTGLAADSGGSGWTTIAYAVASGAQLWSATVAPAFPHYMGPCCVQITATGMVIVGGKMSDETQRHGSFLTVAYRLKSGKTAWYATNPPGFTGYGGVLSVAVSPDGLTSFVTGDLPDSLGHYAATLAAYDTATGAVRWQSMYDPASFFGSTGQDLTVTPDGSRLVLQGSVTNPDRSTTTAATVDFDAATGVQGWTSMYTGGADSAFGLDVAVAPDGSIAYTTTRTCSGIDCENSAYDWALVALNETDGSTAWIVTHQHVPDGGSRVANVVAGDGAVFVTGDDSDFFGHDAFATTAFSAV